MFLTLFFSSFFFSSEDFLWCFIFIFGCFFRVFFFFLVEMGFANAFYSSVYKEFVVLQCWWKPQSKMLILLVFFVTVSFFFFFFWHSVQSAGLFFFFFFSFWCLFIMWNFSCSVLQFPFLNTFFLLKGNRTKYAAKEMILTFAHFAPWLFFFILLPAVFYGGYYYHDGDADSCMHIYK